MHFASGERFRTLAMLHAGQAQGLLGVTRRSICVMVEVRGGAVKPQL
jgi:hypothetical protein